MKISFDDWVTSGDVVVLPHNQYTIAEVISAEYVIGSWEIDFIDTKGHRHFWQQFYDGGTLLQYHTGKGVKVKKVSVEHLKDAGCDNGNYPECTILLDNGYVIHDVTCRCGCGCSGMARLPEVGQRFKSIEHVKKFMNGKEV